MRPIPNDSSITPPGRCRCRGKSGLTLRPMGRNPVCYNYNATLISYRSCLKPIDTFPSNAGRGSPGSRRWDAVGLVRPWRAPSAHRCRRPNAPHRVPLRVYLRCFMRRLLAIVLCGLPYAVSSTGLWVSTAVSPHAVQRGWDDRRPFAQPGLPIGQQSEWTAMLDRRRSRSSTTRRSFVWRWRSSVRAADTPASQAASSMAFRMRLYASRQTHISVRTIAGDWQRSTSIPRVFLMARISSSTSQRRR